jgi:DNA segregation ATPase FtsK/SpoIIIE-like protein
MKFCRRRVVLLLVWFLSLVSVSAWEWSDSWEWSDLVGGSSIGSSESAPTTLSIQEVSDMRARDIKRHLARNHGYGADELAKILDKKELIHALAFEEEKLRLVNEDQVKRVLVKQGIIVSVIVVVVALCWPLFQHAYEVAAVNFVVYTDKKEFEARRCWELQSIYGLMGISAMFVLDMLKAWLTVSILLSWVMRSKYFFPTPSLPIKPGQLMGGEVAKSSLGGYGINVGPMVITWVMGFVYRRLEALTGRALVRAQRKQQQSARDNETPEERSVRRKARKEQKRAAQEEVDARQAAMASMAAAASSFSGNMASAPMNPADAASYMQQPVDHPLYSTEAESQPGPVPTNSRSHDDFIEQLETYVEVSEVDDADGVAAELDDLD